MRLTPAGPVLPRLTVQVLAPVTRVLVRSPALAAVALVGAPVLLTLARRGTDLRLATLATALLGASTLAFSVEDPVTAPSTAAPVSLTWRRVVRFGVLLGAVGLVWSAALLAASLDGMPVGGLDQTVAPTAATASLALAIALVLARRGDPGPGFSGAVGAVLAVLTSSALAPYHDWFPTLGGEPDRWWWVAAVSAIGVVAWWRDPAARRS